MMMIISSLFIGRLLSQTADLVNIPSGIQGDILTNLEKTSPDFGTVTITMDAGIEDNYYKDLIYNQKNKGIKGYRIRIFTGSGNAYEEAKKSRAHFLSLYENIGAYIEYDAPDYKVYVGDCRTRSEILRLYFRIKPNYQNAFWVSHDINIDTDY